MMVIRGVLFGLLFALLGFWAPACWVLAQEPTKTREELLLEQLDKDGKLVPLPPEIAK